MEGGQSFPLAQETRKAKPTRGFTMSPLPPSSLQRTRALTRPEHRCWRPLSTGRTGQAPGICTSPALSLGQWPGHRGTSRCHRMCSCGNSCHSNARHPKSRGETPASPECSWKLPEASPSPGLLRGPPGVPARLWTPQWSTSALEVAAICISGWPIRS